jgi:hypothetical protein
MPWSAKAVRLGRQCGLLTFDGEIEFSPEVAESLRDTGDDWIRGRPLEDSTRVLGNWAEYSTMAMVTAISLGVLASQEDQDLVLLEGQPHLIGMLLELALATGVMNNDDDALSVADDLNEEMMALFENPAALSEYVVEDGDASDAVMLAFVDMVRARLMIRRPEREVFAEALGTLVLSTFGFWQGPSTAGQDIAS